MATYYIDSINGKVQNSGLSENEPKSSHIGLILKGGDNLLFKRGCFIRGGLHNVSGEDGNPITYGAYGIGKNPIFCGSVDMSDVNDWKETDKNIWECVNVPETEACNFIFDNSDLCGALRWEKEDLNEQGEWYDTCIGYGEGGKSFEQYEHKIFMYSKENPAKHYSHIECVVRGERTLANSGHDMIISDLSFINSGVHALSGEGKSHNIKILNCKFEYIGGCVWNKEQKIRFGNGVEFWNVAENIKVENCVFNDIYDSAVTHQGGGIELKPADNLIIQNNIFIKCGMAAFEQRDLLPKYAVFNNNICLDAGMGFSRLGETMPRRSEIYPQPMGHHIFLWRIKETTENARFEIKNNVFGSAPYGGVIYSIISKAAEVQIDINNNIYIVKEKVLLNRLFGEDFKTLTEYQKATGKDTNATEL